MDVNKIIRDLEGWYGDGADGSCPTASQWRRILDRDAESPITLINFFKMRDVADYRDAASGEAISGEDAFAKYSSVSIPTMQRSGGQFLAVGPSQGAFIGEDEDWDLIAIGSFPNLDAFLKLNCDEGYRDVFHHRTAACARQKVMICAE